jgi:cbb3-type cytochrome oxidase subunit 3
MNPVISEGARSVQLGWIMGIMTVLFLSGFLGWAWWAYRPGNRARMEADSRLPFEDGRDS